MSEQPNVRTYSVAEAAAILGVTPETVRKRLQRGKGKFEGGSGVRGADKQWIITLDKPARTEQDAAGQEAGPPRTDGRTEQDSTPGQPRTDPDIATLREELAAVKAERDVLRKQIDDLRDDRDQWRGALAEALRKLPTALPAPADTPTSAPTSPATPGRSLWQRIMGR